MNAMPMHMQAGRLNADKAKVYDASGCHCRASTQCYLALGTNPLLSFMLELLTTTCASLVLLREKSAQTCPTQPTQALVPTATAPLVHVDFSCYHGSARNSVCRVTIEAVATWLSYVVTMAFAAAFALHIRKQRVIL